MVWFNEKQLRNAINSTAAVVSSAHLNKHFYVPKAVSSIFTGRKRLLKELVEVSFASSPDSPAQKHFVVRGLGGSGKTEFCCKFAQVNREKFWGVFWIDASSERSAIHTFSDIAKLGGVDLKIRAAKNWLPSLEYP
ncbi:hypothetical protein EAF04_001944 [Stromatinia cepivora]|nr:hypothetical protein EAF04_001944 [Stromatinia cepivora]